MENNENAKVFGRGALEGITTNEQLQAQKEVEALRAAHYSQAAIHGYHTGYSSPREYLHSFLLQAMQSGCNVESFIHDEIHQMLTELKR